MDPQIQALAGQLGATALRNSASLVTERIRAILARKRDQEAVAELDQIIVDLLADKAEALRIAQAYQERLVAQQITDDEVQYISETVLPMVTKVMEAGGAGDEQAHELLPILEPLVSAETVNVLQLLGFNFRRAIGEPLTELVAHKVSGGTCRESDQVALQRAHLENQTAAMKLSMDPEAYARFRAMYGN